LHNRNNQNFYKAKQLDPVEIVHLVISVENRLLLFQRDCGTWSFLSGEIEQGESLINASCREAAEEVNLIFRQDKIAISGYFFSGFSPKGKYIKGYGLVTSLPEFKPSDLDLNIYEIMDWHMVSVESAFKLLENGFPETKRGLEFLIDRGIVQYSI